MISADNLVFSVIDFYRDGIVRFFQGGELAGQYRLRCEMAMPLP